VSTFYEAKSVNYHKHNKLEKNGGGTSGIKNIEISSLLIVVEFRCVCPDNIKKNA
jgi:hypothetical protein